MNLTAKNVQDTLLQCLSDPSKESHDEAIVVHGIVRNFAFNKAKLAEHHNNIAEMLAHLPDAFLVKGGGGMSFLNACMTKEDVHWGEHQNIEELVVLGVATGQASFCLPREMWHVFPGGMPYFMVDPKPTVAA